MQVACQAAALVFPRGLQMEGQLGQLGSAQLDFRLKAIALSLQHALQFRLLLLQRKRLAQIEKQGKKTDERQAGHTNAIEQDGTKHLAPRPFNLLRFIGLKRRNLHPDRIHLLLANAAHHQFLGSISFSFIVQLGGERHF